MIVRAAGRTWCGGVADLRDAAVDGHDVAEAVRGEGGPVGVHCRPPGPLFDRVGHVYPEMGLRVRTALAVAARTRGLTPPQQAEIERLRTRREEISVDERALRHGEAPDEDLRALRERVAALRGRVQELEASGRDASEATAELRQAAARLSEAETTRIAAAETRRDARDERDRRERRLGLADRIANRERDARSWLFEQVRDPYERAVFALDPGADPFDCPPPVAALAILRIADQCGPVVLATDRFESPAAAAAWIEGSLVRCRPAV